MKLFLENIRSFSGQTSVKLKPLTILVGENSSGKTTFLGMLAATQRPNFPLIKNLFNSPPFEFGSFDNISTYQRKVGQSKSFSLGVINDNETISIIAKFAAKHGLPSLLEYVVTKDKETVRISFEGTLVKFDININIGTKDSPVYKELELSYEVKDEFEFMFREPTSLLINAYFQYQQREKGIEPDKKLDSDSFHYLDRLMNLVRASIEIQSEILSLAPVRTKPHRTYDDISDDFKPEGDHIPFILSRISKDKLKSKIVWDALKDFGLNSGLFTDIKVQRMGNQPSAPFQIKIVNKGHRVNIADVGYGVSQALPVIVESLLAKKKGLMLLQQPEVHLHPRAQAALGTFFSRLVEKEGKKFVIETHSDYLIDRIRLDVATGKLSSEKVQILFFEKTGNDTKVYELPLDKAGNIENAPPCYRNFFLEEEMELMMRTDKWE